MYVVKFVLSGCLIYFSMCCVYWLQSCYVHDTVILNITSDQFLSGGKRFCLQ